MSEATTIDNAENLFGNSRSNGEKLFEEELPYIPKDTMLYEINGPLFFGASQKFQEFLTDLKKEPKVLIIRMRHVPFIDATAVNRLKEFHKKLKSSGTTIIISGANRQVKEELFKSNFYSLIGKNNILDNIDEAFDRTEEILSK
jgi:SulP family sulfate permease